MISRGTFATSISVKREHAARKEKTLDEEYRARVVRLRRLYSTRYASHIADAVAGAPPLTDGQLAHMRRVLKARSVHS